MESADAPVPTGPRGVEGWLLVLCWGLTIFSPIATGVSLVSIYARSHAYFAEFPGLLAVTVIEAVLSVPLMVFSVFAGLDLWRVRPRAVRTAKRYLRALLIYSFIIIPLPFVAGLPSAANEAMLAAVIVQSASIWLGVGIWYAYLSRSKRVRATYGETPLPSKAAASA